VTFSALAEIVEVPSEIAVTSPSPSTVATLEAELDQLISASTVAPLEERATAVSCRSAPIHAIDCAVETSMLAIVTGADGPGSSPQAARTETRSSVRLDIRMGRNLPAGPWASKGS
jgi:hypothetical protein